MKVAIIQPYFFPYLGYFQLIYASDIFIFLDNVQYIDRGWVNRNRIRSKTVPMFFSIPLKKGIQSLDINQRIIDEQGLKRFFHKFLTNLKHNYGKADYYAETMSLIKNVMDNPGNRISCLAEESIRQVCNYLRIHIQFNRASDMIDNKKSKSLSAASRLIELTRIAGGRSYINPIGGKKLYQSNDFFAADLGLYFLSAKEPFYRQGAAKNFIPSLSIIDVLMHNSKMAIRNMLNQAEIVEFSDSEN